jgi:hypothetical protein
MAMPYDLVGRYIDYTVDMGGGKANGQVLTNKTSNASVNVYNTGLVRTGPPWTFTYLKYVLGAVTVCPLTRPVMTGPLSGCYIFRYTQNGPKLAHVGTAHTPTDDSTVQAKTAWRGLIANNTTNITGSSPFNCLTQKDFTDSMFKGSRVPVCVGYYAGGQGYAMTLTAVQYHQMYTFPGRPIDVSPDFSSSLVWGEPGKGFTPDLSINIFNPPDRFLIADCPQVPLRGR